MSTSPEQIVTLWTERQMMRSPIIDQMTQVRDAYNNDMVVALPEMDRQEASMIANLIGSGIDKTAMKVASVTPNLWFPAVEPGNRGSERRAANRRRAVMGQWDADRLGLKMRRRARHLIGYGASPVILRPDFESGIARRDVRDPLSAYPAPSADPDDVTPENILFQFQRTLTWLKTRYPDQMNALHKGKNPMPSDRYDLLEYADGDETVLVVIGQPRNGQEDPRSAVPGAGVVELNRTVNRTGRCLAVMPGRITLDRLTGQFDQLIGIARMQAKLMALEVIAVEKGVFPDQYLVSRPNEQAKFLQGPFEGRTGFINVVQGGEMHSEQLQPGYQTGPMLDRLERNQRVSGGIPSEFGGESATNVRTGKRGDAIMAEVIDTVVQETQELLAMSLQEETKRSVEVQKAYWPKKGRMFIVDFDVPKGKNPDYTPEKDFETSYCTVTYPMAGTDANGLIVGAGQRIGLGTMSKRAFMEIDPMIPDPQRELDRVQYEALETAALQSIQQQAASGALPLADVAAIMKMVVLDKEDLVSAIMKAQAAAQARQAAPVAPDDPAAQAGLGTPGDGAAAPVEPQTVGPPSQNIANLASLLGGLQKSGRTTRPSAPAMTGA